MDAIRDFASLAHRTPCPACGSLTLDFTLRCDLSSGGCLYSACCARCSELFEILAAQNGPDLEAISDVAAPCEICGGTAKTATLHCELSSRSCVYTLECSECARAAA